MQTKTFSTLELAQAFYNVKSDESSVTFCDLSQNTDTKEWIVRWETAEAVEHEVVKVSTGVFQVTNSAWMIFNADAGCSGRGSNTYGIKNTATGERKMIGSLQKAKKAAIAKAKSA